MPQDGPIAPAPPALASLNRSFAIALSKVKFRTAAEANSALEKTKSAKKKKEIIYEHFDAWREDSGAAIRRFFSQYIDLGLAYPSELKSEIVDWAEENAWIQICGQCGVIRFGERHPHRSRSVIWWLALAIDGNLIVPEEEPWRAPI